VRRGARCSGLSEIEAAAPESVEHAFQLEIDRYELEILGHLVRRPGNSPLLEELTLRMVDLENPERGFQVLATQGERIETGSENHVLP